MISRPDRSPVQDDGPPRGRCARAGFTLIELLLVVFIIGIATAIAVPRFMGSFQGAELRSAARTVAMSSRYARNTAVLQQKDMSIIFYPDRNEIEVVSISREADASDQKQFLDSRPNRAMTGLLEADGDPPPEDAAAPRIESEMVRALPDRIQIMNVEVDGEVVELEGSYIVSFFANGMTDAFALNLADEDHRTATIRVDALSGKVTIEYGE